MKSKTIIISAIFIIIAISWRIGITDNGKIVSVDVPLPTNIKILSPAEGLPKGIEAFSGVWEGKCSSTLGDYAVALIVEEINLKEARVIYSRGKVQGGTTLVTPPRFERFNAKVLSDKNQLEFQEGSQNNYIFTMENDLKHLKGTFEYHKPYYYSNKIEMTKTK